MAAEPYARTLWAHLRRREQQELEQLAARSDRLELASHMAIAFHQPGKLDALRQQLEAELTEEAAPALSADEALAAADALFARAFGGEEAATP